MSMAPELTPTAARDQQVFRALVQGFSRPGTIHTIPSDPSFQTCQFVSAASSVLRCLLDHEVTFAVHGFDEGVTEHILRVTGSQVGSVNQADYILCSPDHFADVIDQARTGTDEYPDHSATIIVTCLALASSSNGLVLTGPGIESQHRLRVPGVDPNVFETLRHVNQDYPLGIDVVLVSPERTIVCIPRTITIERSPVREAD
jgi:alpha-D-ribose 1-methylphosphonate 5-triphosphate synthase subunit PhnH